MKILFLGETTMIQLNNQPSMQNNFDNVTSTNNLNSQKPSETTAEYWHRVVEAWLSSGLNKKAFCQQQDISFHALSYWRTRLLKKSKPSRYKPHGKNKGSKKTVLPFSQLTVTLPQEIPNQRASQLLPSSSIEIVIPGDYTVRLPVSIDTLLLKNILLTLGVCHAENL